MQTLQIVWNTCPEELRAGLNEIVSARDDRFAAEGISVIFEHVEAPISAISLIDDDHLFIRYHTRSDAFRALGRALGGATSGEERCRFHTLGAMVDVSRNGVLTVPAVQAWLRHCALMGINTMMLYSEDTYVVPGEPFFGYLRGRYTQDELRELDEYAFNLGIEMVPCIQTLAHLEQVLQWPVYSKLRDTSNVLIAEEDATYAFVEKLIAAASAPFRTKRIHLGMDEAWGLGTGRFKERHGEKSGFEILNTHLARVQDICSRLGLTPMIWGDMYIHLASTSGDIYDYSSQIPQEVIDKIPKGVDLVYWDYYHTKVEDYRKGIDLYRKLGAPVLVAGGGWTWNRLVAHLPYAFAATNACLDACKEKDIRDYFITLWGDDGMECDVFTALPALQLVAEHAYAGTVDHHDLHANFRGACNAELHDFFTASKIDYLAEVHDGTKGPDNMSKWLLWQDPLFAITDPNLENIDLETYYSGLAKTLLEAAENGGLSWHLKLPALIARTLSLKVTLRRNLERAYRVGDQAALRRILNGQLANLRNAMDNLWRCHRDTWLAIYTPFGLEVLETRYGGQRTRLQSLSERLKDYLDGKTEAIPELAADLLKVWDVAPEDVNPSRATVQTPSMIK